MAAIVAGDIKTRFSTTAGAAGNSTAGTAGGSQGKYMSTTDWAGGALNDLFDDISGAENAASATDYRCIFIYNTNAANAYQNVKLWLSAETAGGAAIAIGVDTTAATANNSAPVQALTVANETTAPAGVTFSSPIDLATGVVIGSIPATQCRAFWIRRTAANTAALSNDGVTFSISGDTGSL